MWETCCWKQHRPSIFLLVRHEWVTVSVQIATASPHMMVGSMISSDFFNGWSNQWVYLFSKLLKLTHL
jgi:hypothetical protein